jgi:putative flippase GtrA
VKRLPIVVKYALFAAMATGINIAVQRGVAFFVSGPYSIYISLFFGTISGLTVKYLLDKRFIFYYRPLSRGDETVKVFLYLVMSGFATAVFWAVELSFELLFEFSAARYVGAAVGLTIGYSLKYELDRRFVFIHRSKRKVPAEKADTGSSACSQQQKLRT